MAIGEAKNDPERLAAFVAWELKSPCFMDAGLERAIRANLSGQVSDLEKTAATNEPEPTLKERFRKRVETNTHGLYVCGGTPDGGYLLTYRQEAWRVPPRQRSLTLRVGL